MLSLLLVALLASEPALDLPELPGPVVPTPMPGPDAVQKLGRGQWYVIGSERPLLILPSGSGRVSVSARKGPLVLPADVVVGRRPDADDADFVTVAAPFVYTVRAVKAGPVVLEIIPAVNTVDAAGKPIPLTLADVVRRTLEVELGDAPRPPPEPAPMSTRLAVIVVEETSRRTPHQGKVLFDKSLRDWLVANNHTLAVLDRGDPTTTANGYAPHAEAVGLPAVLVFDATATGPQTPLKAFLLPTSAAEFRRLLEGGSR